MYDYELANLHYSYLTGLYSASNDDEVIEELKYLKQNYFFEKVIYPLTITKLYVILCSQSAVIEYIDWGRTNVNNTVLVTYLF